MPTQTDFERAAGEFDRSATHVEELFTAPRHLLNEGVLIGGLLTAELNLLFDHVRRLLGRRADELRDLAATCRGRAEACAEYRSTLRAFEAASDAYVGELRRWAANTEAHHQAPNGVPSPGPPPVPPEAPPASPEWMSAGSVR